MQPTRDTDGARPVGGKNALRQTIARVNQILDAMVFYGDMYAKVESAENL